MSPAYFCRVEAWLELASCPTLPPRDLGGTPPISRSPDEKFPLSNQTPWAYPRRRAEDVGEERVPGDLDPILNQLQLWDAISRPPRGIKGNKFPSWLILRVYDLQLILDLGLSQPVLGFLLRPPYTQTPVLGTRESATLLGAF